MCPENSRSSSATQWIPGLGLDPDSKNNYFKFDIFPNQVECFEGSWEYAQGQHADASYIGVSTARKKEKKRSGSSKLKGQLNLGSSLALCYWQARPKDPLKTVF